MDDLFVKTHILNLYIFNQYMWSFLSWEIRSLHLKITVNKLQFVKQNTHLMNIINTCYTECYAQVLKIELTLNF